MINEVPYEQVLDIRHQVMYPDKSRDFVALPDDGMAIHIGYYTDDKPVCVMSVFLNDNELQFRKFATLDSYQGKGYGSQLMKWLIDYAQDMKFKRVWCNARADKTDFYKKHGFVETESAFERNGYNYIIVERTF